MSSQLEGFAPYGVCNLKVPYFLPDLDEIAVFEYGKDDYGSQADNKTEKYFFLQGHGC